MKDEGFRPFVNSAVVGGILWLISGGIVHAYLVCLDWTAMGQNATIIITSQQICFVILCGFVLGLAVEIGKFIGALFESPGSVLLLPGIAGAIIGGLQGKYIAADWLNSSGNLLFRPENIRILSGAIIGFIISYPIVIGGIISRQKGRPY